VSPSNPLRETKKPLMRSRASGPKLIRRQRDRKVGSSEPPLAAININSESGGGSSRVFKSAFCADRFIKVAGSKMAIFLLPERARKLSDFSSSRIYRIVIPFFPTRGSIMRTSVWVSYLIRAQSALSSQKSPAAAEQ